MLFHKQEQQFEIKVTWHSATRIDSSNLLQAQCSQDSYTRGLLNFDVQIDSTLVRAEGATFDFTLIIHWT